MNCLFALFLLLCTGVVEGDHHHVIMGGFDADWNLVLANNRTCKYPHDCYKDMARLLIVPNVTYIGMRPIMTPPHDCNIGTDDTDDMYLIVGVDSDFQYIKKSAHLSYSMWNSLSYFCDIISLPNTMWTMITPFNAAS